MKEVVINETDIVSAANEGMDSFLSLFVKSIKDSIGGELTAETMPMLNVNQITLLAYDIFHEEVMDGGFVQLIHNGYGGFIFQNPFAKVLKMWGLRDLSKCGTPLALILIVVRIFPADTLSFCLILFFHRSSIRKLHIINMPF